jgi:hypothetical protein
MNWNYKLMIVQDIYLNTSRPNVFDSQRFAQMNDVADRKMDRLSYEQLWHLVTKSLKVYFHMSKGCMKACVHHPIYSFESFSQETLPKFPTSSIKQSRTFSFLT